MVADNSFLGGEGGHRHIIYDRISHEAKVLAASGFVRRFSPKDLIYDRPFSTCVTTRGTVSFFGLNGCKELFDLQYYPERSPYNFGLCTKLKEPLSGSVESNYEGYRVVI
jgi:hypothetical protein